MLRSARHGALRGDCVDDCRAAADLVRPGLANCGGETLAHARADSPPLHAGFQRRTCGVRCSPHRVRYKIMRTQSPHQQLLREGAEPKLGSGVCPLQGGGGEGGEGGSS